MSFLKEETTGAGQKKDSVETEVFQCPECFTVYDKNYGDESRGIPAGTKFGDLPANYSCPVCEEPKGSFKRKVFIRRVE